MWWQLNSKQGCVAHLQISKQCYLITKINIFTQGKLTNVVAKRPGSCQDSFIFYSLAHGRRLEKGVHNTENGVLLGDSGYALRSYLMNLI